MDRFRGIGFGRRHPLADIQVVDPRTLRQPFVAGDHSRLPISDAMFRERVVGNRFRESGCLERLLERSTSRRSLYGFVCGKANRGASDGFDRLVIVVPAFVGSAAV